jgi:hypothetical protein
VSAHEAVRAVRAGHKRRRIPAVRRAKVDAVGSHVDTGDAFGDRVAPRSTAASRRASNAVRLKIASA